MTAVGILAFFGAGTRLGVYESEGRDVTENPSIHIHNRNNKEQQGTTRNNGC